MKKNQSVDTFIEKHKHWSDALQQLRRIVLSTGLEETLKWGMPTYTADGKNIVGLGAFKAYVGVWFFQGALLEDRENKLINAQEGKTVAMRQWRFNTQAEIDASLLSAYIDEAIQNHQEGRVIKPAKAQKKPLIISEELSAAFDQNVQLKQQFDQLSLSKRREFADYVREAKRQETREKRLETILPLILEGRGLYEKYK